MQVHALRLHLALPRLTPAAEQIMAIHQIGNARHPSLALPAPREVDGMVLGMQPMDRISQRAPMRAFAVVPATGKDVAAGSLTLFPDQGGVLQFVQPAARKIREARLPDRNCATVSGRSVRGTVVATLCVPSRTCSETWLAARP